MGGRPEKISTEHLVPTDDEVWNRRDLSAAKVARAVGMQPGTFRKWTAQRGWKRNHAGRIIKAPCRRCNASTELRNLNDARECYRHWEGGPRAQVDPSVDPDVAACRSELAAFLRRHPNMRGLCSPDSFQK
jgi:hypothetical protein